MLTVSRKPWTIWTKAPARATQFEGEESVGFNMIYCGKAGFGQISRSLSFNSGAIGLKRSKNLTQTGSSSL